MITIVINCFNRKEYLLDAVNSALRQTAPRDLYDIIVIKNFSDELINNYLFENGIKNIEPEEETTGSWFIIAARESKSNFISFLDDDDIIHPDKISILLRVIEEYPQTTFIHNLSVRNELIQDTLIFNAAKVETIIDNSVSNFKNCLSKKRYFNLSSITVHKDVILANVEFVKETNHGTDMIMFAASKLISGTRIHYERGLTFFRVHGNSQGNFKSKDRDDFEDRKRNVLPSHITNWELISDLLKDTPLGNYASLRLISTKIWLNIVSERRVCKIGFKDIIKGIRYIQYYPLIIFFLYIDLIDRISHNIIRNIYFKFLFSWIGWRLRENI